ncbi:MAG: DUF4340 domain-containing protein [Betaproteobacteria bacterium]|nr:MAG: DUF4340 domain-containing protein [Betaproteobacteria bacterium]
MRRGWLLNLALLAAVAALAWFAWRTPSRDEVAKQTLSALRSAEIRRITLARPGQPVIELERRGTQWLITVPVRARADDFQVLRMLTVLEARPTAQLPATDLQRFDLQSPAAQLTIDGVDYAFGAVNAVTREQYVMRGDRVYAVELRHGAGLPADAGALIRRVLLAENEQPVDITLPQFNLRQAGGKWTIAPAAGDPVQDDLQRYVDQWRHASATKAEPYDGRPALTEIRMTLRDGAVVEFGVLEHEPQLVLWRRDNGLQYWFSAATGRALLTAPASPPEHIITNKNN